MSATRSSGASAAASASSGRTDPGGRSAGLVGSRPRTPAGRSTHSSATSDHVPLKRLRRLLLPACVAFLAAAMLAGAGVSASGDAMITLSGAGQIVPLSQLDLNFAGSGQVAAIDVVA